MKEFRESTRFPIFISVLFFFQVILFGFYYFKKDNINNYLLYIVIIFSFIGLFFILTKLKLIVNESKIMFSFSPLPFYKIEMKDIDKIEFIDISKSKADFGLGVRYSKDYGWCWISDSKFILCITKNSGKKISVSIKDKISLENFLIDNSLI
ncbi:MAG: hypothetical protein V4589_10490 [Bacteroidota bacterium]